MPIELTYCAGGNRHFAKIAIDHGFLYGAQVPATLYFEPHFCDQDWNAPNYEKYMRALKKHKPSIASVIDFEYKDQLLEVLKWAESAAAFVDTVMIIPKVVGTIDAIPKTIGGKPVRLGYSVPTKFGGTGVPVWEFGNRPVHLLGGSPHKQKELTYYLNVKSLDGNMHQKMAVKYCSFYDPGKTTKRGYWPTFEDYDGEKWGDGSSNQNAPYEAFRRSCKSIKEMWGY